MGTPKVLTPLLQGLNLTEVSGNPQGLQANLTRAPGGGRPAQGVQPKPTPAVTRAEACCTPGVAHALLSTSEWLILKVNPQATLTFLPFSSGPEPFQQHPASQSQSDGFQLCRRSQKESLPVGNGRKFKASPEPMFLWDPQGQHI